MRRNKEKKSKKWIIGLIAVLAAITGLVVAFGAYLKKHAAFLNETLDYDDELFYEDDYPEDDELDGEIVSVPEEDDIIETAFDAEGDEPIN